MLRTLQGNWQPVRSGRHLAFAALSDTLAQIAGGTDIEVPISTL